MPPDKITERSIQDYLLKKYQASKYHLLNAHVFQWECDYFHLTNTGYAVEIEIKISRADFKADFKKEKHRLFENMGRTWDKVYDSGNRYEFLLDKENPECRYVTEKGKEVWRRRYHIPNRFYYCVPEGLVDVDEIPQYAGLLVIGETSDHTWQEPYIGVKQIKQAPLLHKRKGGLYKILLDKFYWRYIRSLEKKGVKDLEYL